MSSSSGYYPDAESYIIGEKRPLQLLNPNQFYKICPGLSGGNNGTSSKAFRDDEPICGDGSPFCFFYSKPSQKHSNREKLLIEIMGGGACWDSDTCEMQADMLYLSEDLDAALGKSCQEIQYGTQMDGTETNMLCSSQLGDESDGSSYVDFTQYNSIIIPYCTQDVHLGSKTMVYNDNDDDGSSRVVHHKGANNLRSVFNWITTNFPAMRHAAVTGCSAGGTAVPVFQQLLNKHYNHFGNRATQVTAIADSPVYLTPTYFLENALDHWNPQPILSSIGIPYEKYRSSEDYPTMMWDHILRKGSNKNRWGFVSHTDDPVSLTYYQYMIGDDGDNGDDYNNKYNGLDEQWYSELTASVSYIQKRHRNVKSYWMESEGHCTFGLYYALQEDGFSDFAASIFNEDALYFSSKPATRAFFSAAGMGTLLLAWLVFYRIRRQSTLEAGMMDDDVHSEDFTSKEGLWAPPSPKGDDSESLVNRWSRSVRRWILLSLVSMEDYPVTSGYTVWITVYFLAMLYLEGFAHPVNNPALGPSAVGLSDFGINNPSMIVYKHQWFRLFTSNFLVSGILTLVLAYFYLWYRIRKLEQRMIHDFKSPWLFVTITIVLATTINAAYCLVPQRRGASTTAIPLLIGLQTFHLTFYWNFFLRPYLSIGAIVFDAFLVVTLFPFNSWIMIVAGMVTGWITAKGARTMDVWLPGPMMNVLKETGIQLELGIAGGGAGSVVSPGGPAVFGTALTFPPRNAASESEYNNFDVNGSNSYITMDDQRSTCPDHNRSRRGKFLKKTLCSGLLVVCVLLVVPLFVTLVATPSETYLEAFRTGCESFYTVDLDDLSASSFLYGGDDDNYEGGDRSLVAFSSSARDTTESFVRWLAGEDKEEGSYGCAEFCVPHLLVPFANQVLKKKKVPIGRGTCSDHGYSTHVLDKTFTAFTYSLDVEMYGASNYDDDDEDEK